MFDKVKSLHSVSLTNTLKDGNGYITADELHEVLANDKDIKEGVWFDLIKEVDQNSDGQVQFLYPRTIVFI